MKQFHPVRVLLVGVVVIGFADSSVRGNRHRFRSWLADDGEDVSPAGVDEDEVSVQSDKTDESVKRASVPTGDKRSRAKEREKRSELSDITESMSDNWFYY